MEIILLNAHLIIILAHCFSLKETHDIQTQAKRNIRSLASQSKSSNPVCSSLWHALSGAIPARNFGIDTWQMWRHICLSYSSEALTCHVCSMVTGLLVSLCANTWQCQNPAPCHKSIFLEDPGKLDYHPRLNAESCIEQCLPWQLSVKAVNFHPFLSLTGSSSPPHPCCNLTERVTS